MAADPRKGPHCPRTQLKLFGSSPCKGEGAASADPEKSEFPNAWTPLTPSSESYTFIIRSPSWV